MTSSHADGCSNPLEPALLMDYWLTVMSAADEEAVETHLFTCDACGDRLREREYAPPHGESIQCTVAADDDLLVARLAADLSTAQRVDLSWCDPRGVELQRLADIPIRADGVSVICQQSITWAKASPTSTMTARLLAVDDAGSERVLGEYTFHHTRTIPGPPGWTLP
jgi:hypothetical protein